MYLPPQIGATFRRVQRLRCPPAELRRLAAQEDVWASALPWFDIERFQAEASGRLSADGVVRAGPFRLRLHLEGRLTDEGEKLVVRLSGTLQHAIRLSAEAVATAEGGGSSLQCSVRVDRLPQIMHLALASAETRAVRAAVAAVEAFAACRTVSRSARDASSQAWRLHPAVGPAV